jgi:NAD(P)-dependent dehydrogenase (short-subunit alcohol dehydrogenase family)
MEIDCRTRPKPPESAGKELCPTLSNNGLRGRVAVIASHRSGKCIPSELAQILAYEGARVYAADTSPRVAEIVKAETMSYTGYSVEATAFDFFEKGAVDRFIQTVEQDAGRIDILATDLGLLDFMHHLKPFSQQEKEDWDTQYRDIVEAAFIWSKAAARAMTERNHGRIIHMVSDTARLGVPKMSVYGAFKAAVSSFSRALAQELARYKITVNCVSLGLQEIDEVKNAREEAVVKMDKTLKLVPLRRYSEPEELAAMIAYLASDLGSYITGQTISVSGGLLMT